MMKMRAVFAGLVGLLLATQALAQAQLGAGQVWGNNTAARAPGQSATLTSIIDRAIGATRGSVLERGASGWGIVVPSATVGLAWISQGTGADPIYGVVSLAGGGCNAALTASNGGIVYSTASACAILAGTATASRVLLSGSSAAPAWSTATYPGTAAAGTLLAAGTANVISATAQPNLGANGGTGGQFTLNGSTSGSAVIKTAAAAGTTNFQLPVGNGTSGFLLSTDGAGVTSWVTSSSSTELVNAQTGTSYAILDGDRGKLVTAINAGAQAYTIAQAGAASAFLAGWWADVSNKSTNPLGVVTITPTTSTIDGAATLVLAPGQGVRIVSDGTNYQISALTGVRTVKQQKFTANGTYTPSNGMVAALIECVGGGGGGGGAGGAVGAIYFGSGGGSGGYSRVLVTAATVGASLAVTIGPGGAGGTNAPGNGAAGTATQVGSVCIANGGGAGVFTSNAQNPAAGAGATAGTGDLAIPGNAGSYGVYSTIATVYLPSGAGAASYLGGAPVTTNAGSATSATGAAAVANTGAGGSGGGANNVAANVGGGAGGSGVVFITEYTTR